MCERESEREGYYIEVINNNQKVNFALSVTVQWFNVVIDCFRKLINC